MSALERLEILIDHEPTIVFAERLGDQLWIHVNGKNLCFQKEKKSFSVGEALGGRRSLEITSPMPGKILKILKKTGDEVREGDTVVVMEAMKMEYSLKASASYRISDILCQAGDQVKLGQKLVSFAEEG